MIALLELFQLLKAIFDLAFEISHWASMGIVLGICWLIEILLSKLTGVQSPQVLLVVRIDDIKIEIVLDI